MLEHRAPLLFPFVCCSCWCCWFCPDDTCWLAQPSEATLGTVVFIIQSVMWEDWNNTVKVKVTVRTQFKKKSKKIWFFTLCCLKYLTYWLIWKMWVYDLIRFGLAGWWQKLSCCNFLGHYKCDECQTLRDGTTHWALPIHSCSEELCTQKLKSHLVRTQCLNILPEKPGVGQYIAIHATLTAWGLFLAYFYPSVPFTCIFPKTSPDFSCVSYG